MVLSGISCIQAGEDGDRCFMKIVARAEDHQIVGAQLMCHNSTDMISQISQAIANHMTAEQLLMAMRPHPTFEEAMSEALEDLMRKLKDREFAFKTANGV